MNFKVLIVAPLLCVVLTSCETTGPKIEYRWRNASDSASWDKDTFECEGLAARTYPTANVTNKYGDDSQTNNTSCFAVGGIIDCHTLDTSFPSFEVTSDSNKSNREAYYLKCLKMKGWEKYATTSSTSPNSKPTYGNNSNKSDSGSSKFVPTRWRKAGETSQATTYVDPESKQTIDGKRLITVLLDYKTMQDNDAPRKPVKSAVGTISFQCSESLVAPVIVTYFSLGMGGVK